MKPHHIHAAAGLLAFALIATFWLGTVGTELSGSASAIAWAKSAILWSMLLLIPALIATGASGFVLGRKMRLPEVAAKKKRMPFIAGNGLLVLLPSAFFLAARAGAGVFDTSFYLVQGVELVAGAVNLGLIGLNIRDGMTITRRRGADPKQVQKSVPRFSDKNLQQKES